MRKYHIIFAAAAVMNAAPAFASEEHRELGAHEHGHGTLNMAIEAGKVSMELEVPGADIVGFEHEASTDEQKAAIEKAKATLSDALTVFKLPSDAGCKLTNAKVALEAEEHHDGAKHEEHVDHKDEAKHEDHAEHKDEAGEEEHHAEFHAEYALECSSPEKLTSIDFHYFELFPGAQELDVNLVSAKGQTKYEVTREQPKLELGEIG